jgi:hypothetical protein
MTCAIKSGPDTAVTSNTRSGHKPNPATKSQQRRHPTSDATKSPKVKLLQAPSRNSRTAAE